MIRIKSIELENFRGFEKAHIDFSDHITCIAGINGAGKSTVLDAVKKVLTWLTEMINQNHHNGEFLSKSDVRISSTGFSRINGNIEINGFNNKIIVGLDVGAPGFSIKFADKPEMQDLYKKIQITYPENKSHSIPVFTYYTVNRSELDIDVSMEDQKDLSNMYCIYDDALNSVTHYKSFFRWFRDREDRENEVIREKYDSGDVKQRYSDKYLDAVRFAITSILPEYKSLKVLRKTGEVVLQKGNLELSITLLSDGEKDMISLFGDIARRLAMANPEMNNPLQGEGIILIDEIELHLHPEWQRRIVHALTSTFPNCQFIITTHSPQVIGEIEAKDLRLLNNGQIYQADHSYGFTSDDILDEVMNTDSAHETLVRNTTVSGQLQALSKAMAQEDYVTAKKLIADIEAETNGPLHETRQYAAEIQMAEGLK